MAVPQILLVWWHSGLRPTTTGGGLAEARRLFLTIHVGARAQAIGPFSIAFPQALAGSQIRSEAAPCGMQLDPLCQQANCNFIFLSCKLHVSGCKDNILLLDFTTD